MLIFREIKAELGAVANLEHVVIEHFLGVADQFGQLPQGDPFEVLFPGPPRLAKESAPFEDRCEDVLEGAFFGAGLVVGAAGGGFEGLGLF